MTAPPVSHDAFPTVGVPGIVGIIIERGIDRWVGTNVEGWGGGPVRSRGPVAIRVAADKACILFVPLAFVDHLLEPGGVVLAHDLDELPEIQLVVLAVLADQAFVAVALDFVARALEFLADDVGVRGAQLRKIDFHEALGLDDFVVTVIIAVMSSMPAASVPGAAATPCPLSRTVSAASC